MKIFKRERVRNAPVKIFKCFLCILYSSPNADKEHLHNHLVVNSVSFENGYKIQMSKKNLQYLKNYSDEICLEMGASVIHKKDKTNYIKRNEYRVAERGESWKFKLINAIDLSMVESTCKDDFIKTMNKLGYQVNWTDTRKYITYTTPEGYKCRDNKLFEEKYLKGNMEDEFRKIEREQQNSTRKSSSSISSTDELLYIIEPTVLKDIYDWNKEIKEEIWNTRKTIYEILSKIEMDNKEMKEELPTIISERMEKEFQIMKEKLQDSEEEQTLKFKKIKWKTRLIAFFLGLLLSAIWFLTHK